MAEQPDSPLNRSSEAGELRPQEHRTGLSVRSRVVFWTAAAFASALALLTVVNLMEERRQIVSLEEAQASALLSHLARMPEFRNDPDAAAHQLAMLQDMLRAAGAHIELRLPGQYSTGDAPRAVQTLRFENTTLELRYLSDPARLGQVMRRSILMHASYGLATLCALVAGMLWILKRRLVVPLERITHQLTRMRTGGGWIAAVPQSDTELMGLVDAVRKLGPGLADQVEQWVRAERRAASALTLGRVQRCLNEPLRLLQLHATNLQSHQMLNPEMMRQVRALLVAADGVHAAIRAEEEQEFENRRDRKRS